jgi:hypothetical protein
LDAHHVRAASSTVCKIMKIRFVTLSALAAGLVVASPVTAQSVAEPAILSLAVANAIAPAPRTTAYSGVWLKAEEPIRSGPHVDVHRYIVATAPTDRLVSGSVQFDYGAAGLGSNVSTFGFAHRF